MRLKRLLSIIKTSLAMLKLTYIGLLTPYKVYLEMLEEEEEKVRYLNTENVKKTKEGLALDKLDLKDICCRRHFLTHVDII